MDGPWDGYTDLGAAQGPHGGRAGAEGQGWQSRGQGGTAAIKTAELEMPPLAGCLFWWFGEREEERPTSGRQGTEMAD